MIFVIKEDPTLLGEPNRVILNRLYALPFKVSKSSSPQPPHSIVMGNVNLYDYLLYDTYAHFVSTLLIATVINPRRACAARVASLCLSTTILALQAAYERYQQLQCYKGMKNNVAILLKRLRSRDMA